MLAGQGRRVPSPEPRKMHCLHAGPSEDITTGGTELAGRGSSIPSSSAREVGIRVSRARLPGFRPDLIVSIATKRHYPRVDTVGFWESARSYEVLMSS